MKNARSEARAACLALALQADAHDRSWSVLASGGAEERFLSFFDGVSAADLIARTAARMGLPEALIGDWRAALDGADALGLAVNRDLTSVRLYTQYWGAQVARVEAGDMAPFAVYRGFKALPDGTTREDRYLCRPMAPGPVFWGKIGHLAEDFGLDAEAFPRALPHLLPETCIYTETDAPGRESWLATVRRAEPDRAGVAELLAPLRGSDWGDALHDHARQFDLLHIAGGTDATKGPFASFYFTSTPDIVQSRLGAPG